MFRGDKLLLLAVACSPLVIAAADDKQPDPRALDVSSIVQMMGAMPLSGAAEAPPFPKFEDVTKDMVSKKGLFILWHYPPDAKDKDPEKLLAQIPSGFLGEQFMLSTSFSGGGFLTGFPLDERVVRWELLDRQLLLVQPETRFVVDQSKEVSDVVRRTYPDRIRMAVPLVTKAPNGDPVIDLGALLKSEFADILWATFFDASGMPGGRINPALSKWVKHKSFELNVEIGVELAVARFAPPGSYDKKLVHYSFWKLPQTDYRPRVADDRVGYFLTTNQDWSKASGERDIFNRYIDRWHLVKRDPSLKMCEPRQPIVFYIEKTVPVKYRRAVRDGILEWNRAYEQVGFVNAIEVRQQTDDNEWRDLDPEDMRYSFFRWIVTGAGFAMGPHRANPFTGQIYDADIIFDDSMVRFFEREAQQYLPATAVAQKFHDPALARFLEQYPQWQRPVRTWETVFVGSDEERGLRERLLKRMRERGMHICDYAEGMKHQMAVANAVLAGQPPEVIDRFLYDVIKEVVAHEVGHTLGLRHNFKASSIYALEEIQKRRPTDAATCGSVMDYNPTLLFADKATEGHFVTPTIGPYDYWAIEYGYRPIDGSYKGKEAKEGKEEGAAADKKDAQAAAAEKTEVAAPPPVAEMPAMPEGMKIDLSQIPPEIMAQLPPEIKKMIESGQIAGAINVAAGMPVTPARSAEGAKFAAPPAGEEAMLLEIAGRAAEPELAYATDEDTTFVSPDPATNRFDAGADPVDWARTRIELVDQRMENMLEWAVQDKESWYYLRTAFLTLMFEKAYVLDYVGRYIGGQYFVRSHRGDPQAAPPFVLVDADRQRAALKFIEEHLFQDKFFEMHPEVLNHLAPARWWHEGTSISFTIDFPVHQYVAMLQWWNVFDRLFPNTLRRIQDAELKTDAKKKLTVAEYIQRVQKACWADAADSKRLKSGTWEDAKPFISSLRRSLQREYLGVLEPLIREGPGLSVSPDLHAMLQYSLQTLARELTEVIDAGKADFASQAHLVACKSRIERMLTAELKEYEPFGFGGMSFMRDTGTPPK